MSWEQGQAWQAYASVEPFGEQRADLRSAISASAIVNVLIQANSSKRAPRLTSPSDFMLDFAAKPKAMKPMSAEQWKRAKSMARVLAGGK